MRSIAIPISDRPESATALHMAFTIAQSVNSNLTGYHLRPHASEASVKSAAGKRLALNSKSARALFGRISDEYDFAVRKQSRASATSQQASWHELKGSPERVFPIIGPMSDLIVVSRPSGKSSKTAKQFQLAALMRSSSPVLIVPPRQPKSIAKRILIAWNQSPEAAAAVKAAVPLMVRAETVVIASAGREDGAGPKTRQVQQYLKHWGVRATRIATPGRRAEEELLTSFDETASDLLVMGAYSRPRWRETIFGGFTEQMLTHGKMPVLMVHR